VLVCGDLNVNYTFDRQVRDVRFPYAVFEQIGVRASYRTLGRPGVGTKDNRLIDYVGHTVSSRIAPTSQSILSGYGSDHRPLVVTFNLAVV
jgi:endonuclease/exonuclease/phosphatase (EEP) superfamily protein YafD